MFNSDRVVKIIIEGEIQQIVGERENDPILESEMRVDADDNDDKVLDPETIMSMEKVFGNEMLLELILEHVIYPSPVKSIDRSDVRSLRLVQKSWLGCVGDILCKNREYLFRCVLNRENSVAGTDYCNNNGKLLRRIIATILNPTGSSSLYQTPTFAIQILPEFFRKENYDDLAECLEKCGHALTHVDLFFPLNLSMPMTFYAFTLPKLKHLGVQYTAQRVSEDENQVQFPPQNVYPLQTILNAVPGLKQVELKFTLSEALIPYGFGYLRLPSTIKYLLLDCPLKNEDLEILTRNDLPNLRHLRLMGTNRPYNTELVSQILAKFGASLESLGLMKSYYNGHQWNTTQFRMPRMDNLEKLLISTTWELEEGVNEVMDWGTCLPKLKTMHLYHQTEALFIKWVGNSMYETVTGLSISLVDINIDAAHNLSIRDHHLTIDRDRMRLLHVAFPNITSLDITMCGTLTDGLKHLFIKMRNLRHLALNLVGSRPDQLQSVHWDALLIGVPPEMATYMSLYLQMNPGCRPDYPLLDDEYYPSIRLLSDLQSLKLVENFQKSVVPMNLDNAGEEKSLISDLAFLFGFLKMPNLIRLLLAGDFKASAAMVQRWKQEKGIEIQQIK